MRRQLTTLLDLSQLYKADRQTQWPRMPEFFEVPDPGTVAGNSKNSGIPDDQTCEVQLGPIASS